MASNGSGRADGKRQFVADVFPAELKEIQERQRAALGRVDKGLAKGVERLQTHPGKPSTEIGLVGLAFSGGGIRSATFNLGVLQALAKQGILKYVDYLSTVSGGGYIGASLSSLLNSKDAESDGLKFPLRYDHGISEPAAVKHLRNSSNYLTPNSLLDQIRIPALLLRGVLVNLLVMLPWLLLTILVTNWFYGADLREDSSIWVFYRCTPWVAGVFLAWVLLFPLSERIFLQGRNWQRRDWYEKSFAAFFLAILIVIVWESLPPSLLLYRRLAQGETSDVEFWTMITAVASLVPYFFTGSASRNLAKWTGKLGLVILGLLGPFILLLIFLLLGSWIIFDAPEFLLTLRSRLNDWLWLDRVVRSDFLVAAAAIAIALYNLYFVDVNSNSLHRFYRDRLSRAYLLSRVGRKSVRPNDNQRLSGLNTKYSKAPYHLLNATLNLHGNDDPDLRGRRADFFIFSKHYTGGEWTGYCQTQDLEQRDRHTDLATAMAISGAAAAPNMGTTTIKPLVFILGLLNIRLGYWLPNPYRVRNEGYRFLSGMIRVGPFYLLRELFGRLNDKSLFVNVSDGAHIENLGIYELLRRRCRFIIAGDAEADPNTNFTGLATLIRLARIDLGIEIELELEDLKKQEDGLSRKHCTVGIIRYGDGETGHLLYVKSSLTGDENPYINEYRAQHPDFPHQSTADQFFDEAQFEAYRALGYHIVDELLEDRIVSKSPGPATRRDEVDLEQTFQQWRDYLRLRYQSEDKFVGLQTQLGTIERAFMDEDVAEYTYQIYPELARRQPSDPSQPTLLELPPASDEKACERLRKIFHLCTLQMELMENVFVVLKLENPLFQNLRFNRGWMNLFRRWAQAPYFRWAWAVSIGTYSAGFQAFCENALKLNSEIEWKRIDGTEFEKILTNREQEYLQEQEKTNRFESKREDKQESADNQSSPLPQDQIWLASMSISLTPSEGTSAAGDTPDATRATAPESFPIGMLTVRISPTAPAVDDCDCQATVMFYRIRDYYRQMGLLELMMQRFPDAIKSELKASLKKERPKLRVNFSKDRDDLRVKYGYFFERNGFEVVQDT